MDAKDEASSVCTEIPDVNDPRQSNQDAHAGNFRIMSAGKHKKLQQRFAGMGDDRYNNFQMQDEQVRDDFSEHSTSMQDRSQFGSLTFVDGQMMQLVLKTKIERNEQKVMVVLKKSGSRLVVQNQVVPKKRVYFERRCDFCSVGEHIV